MSMNLREFLKACRRCQGGWISEGEVLASLHRTVVNSKQWAWAEWGVKMGYLSFKYTEGGKRVDYTFTEKGMVSVVRRLKETTCAFSGRQVK